MGNYIDDHFKDFKIGYIGSFFAWIIGFFYSRLSEIATYAINKLLLAGLFSIVTGFCYVGGKFLFDELLKPWMKRIAKPYFINLFKKKKDADNNKGEAAKKSA